MNKNEIVAVIAEEFEISKETAKQIVGRVSGLIIAGVKQNGKFVWPELGTFSKSKRSRRKGRNPMTGEAIDIPEKNVPKFSPTKVFKDEVA
jgi:DNA-binding protein HU-beta